MNTQDAGKRLNQISCQLRECHEALGKLVSEEITLKTDSYKTNLAQGLPITAVEKMAAVSAANKSTRIVELRGEIASLEEESTHMRFMIKHGLGDIL